MSEYYRHHPPPAAGNWIEHKLDEIERRLAAVESQGRINQLDPNILRVPSAFQPNYPQQPAVRQHVVQHPPKPQWRPISEAPKDGTRLLLFVSHFPKDKIQIAEWSVDEWHIVGLARGPLGFKPTHWTPLPAPPGKEAP